MRIKLKSFYLHHCIWPTLFLLILAHWPPLLNDSRFKFDKQINQVVKVSFMHICIISKLRSILSTSELKKVIHAFISSHLDYCSLLYFGITQSCLSRLQLVPNAAARILTKSKKTLLPFLPPYTGCLLATELILKSWCLFSRYYTVLPPLTLQHSCPHITLSETKDFCLSQDPGLSVTGTGPSLLLPQSYGILFLPPSDSPPLPRFSCLKTHLCSLALNCAWSLCRSVLSLWALCDHVPLLLLLLILLLLLLLLPVLFIFILIFLLFYCVCFLLLFLFSSVCAVEHFGSAVLCVESYINKADLIWFEGHDGSRLPCLLQNKARLFFSTGNCDVLTLHRHHRKEIEMFRLRSFASSQHWLFQYSTKTTIVTQLKQDGEFSCLT